MANINGHELKFTGSVYVTYNDDGNKKTLFSCKCNICGFDGFIDINNSNLITCNEQIIKNIIE